MCAKEGVYGLKSKILLNLILEGSSEVVNISLMLAYK